MGLGIESVVLCRFRSQGVKLAMFLRVMWSDDIDVFVHVEVKI